MKTAPKSVPQKSSPLQQTGVVDKQVYCKAGPPHTVPEARFPSGLSQTPLSSEYGTCETVKARFWPWLSGKSA